jgi:ketosteroid isomerase-like protein
MALYLIVPRPPGGTLCPHMVRYQGDFMRYYVLVARLAGLTLCLALNACITAADFPSDDEDRTALEQIRGRILEAELKGDASVFEQVAAPDVLVQPPNAGMVSGREASVELMRQFFNKYELRIEYASAQIQVNGDEAFDRGSYSQTMVPKDGGAPVAGKGNYWWFYARADDGNWQQTHVIWTNE